MMFGYDFYQIFGAGFKNMFGPLSPQPVISVQPQHIEVHIIMRKIDEAEIKSAN